MWWAGSAGFYSTIHQNHSVFEWKEMKEREKMFETWQAVSVIILSAPLNTHTHSLSQNFLHLQQNWKIEKLFSSLIFEDFFKYVKSKKKNTFV